MATETEKALAKAIQNACVQAAQDGFQDASMQGLCHEGAVEAAISAIQMVKLDDVIEQSGKAVSKQG